MIELAEKVRHVVVTMSNFPERAEIRIGMDEIMPFLNRMEKCEKKFKNEFLDEDEFFLLMMGMRLEYLVEFIDGKGDELGRIRFTNFVIQDANGEYCLKKNGDFICLYSELQALINCYQEYARDNQELENSKFMLRMQGKGLTAVIYSNWHFGINPAHSKIHRKVLEEV